MDEDFRRAVLKEVAEGLRNERKRMREAAENQDFLELDAARYVRMREAEDQWDYDARPKRTSGFVHQAVGRLCEHTYNPGPARTVVGDEPARKLLEAAYKGSHIDAIMQEAERTSTLNDVVAIQIRATGDDTAPVDLQVWGPDEFAVFEDPDDQRRVLSVVVVDRWNQRTRYRAWLPDEVVTFVTDEGVTASASARESRRDPNPYGRLPFSFVHYSIPVRRFWTTSPGSFLKHAEANVNDALSDLAETMLKYQRPIGIFTDVSVEFNPTVGPGRFLRLSSTESAYSGDGFSAPKTPTASYLQAELQIAQAWQDIQAYLSQAAEAVDLPASSLRLDYNDAPSGVSLVIHQVPLLTRARKRRPVYQWAELQLARAILECVGAVTGRPELVASAKTLDLLLAWPEPRIPIPGTDRDAGDLWEIQLGIKSRVRVAQERFGLTPEQAVAHIKQVAEEERDTTAAIAETQRDQTRLAPGDLDGLSADLESEETED